MAVKASDFIKKKGESKASPKKGGKASLLDWIGDRRNAKKAASDNKGKEDDHDE